MEWMKLAQRRIVWTIGFRKWQEDSWAAKQRFASKEELCLKEG
jgi:hypothetical protein